MIAAYREPSRALPTPPVGTGSSSARKLRASLRLGVLAVVLSTALAAPSPALAESADAGASESCAPPPPADTEDAKTAFRDGQAAFTEGAYSRAVALWTEAYRLDCTAHALLLNLAMGQELLGHPEDAARTLELFNRRAPDSPYVDANRKRIDHLRRVWAEQSRARAREQRKSSAPMPAPAPVSTSADTNIVPLSLAVGGGIVALTGAALYIHGRAGAASAADRCGETRASCANPDAVVDGERARERQEVAGWLTGAGLVTAAAGTLWYLLSPYERASDGVDWGASVSNTGTSLYVSGTY